MVCGRAQLEACRVSGIKLELCGQKEGMADTCTAQSRNDGKGMGKEWKGGWKPVPKDRRRNCIVVGKGVRRKGEEEVKARLGTSNFYKPWSISGMAFCHGLSVQHRREV